MKKLITLCTLLLCAVVTAWADTGTSVTASWLAPKSSMDLNGSSTVSEALIANTATLSSKVKYVSTWSKNSTFYYTIDRNDDVQDKKGSINTNRYVDFTATVVSGINFTLTKVEVVGIGAGTGNNSFRVDFIDSESTTTLRSAATVASGTEDPVEHTFASPKVYSGETTLTIRVYIGINNTSDTKNVGLRDVKLIGTYEEAVLTKPAITSQPLGDEYKTGGVATALSVTAKASAGELSYQWYSNTIESTDGASAISGATSSSYVPSTASAGTTYYYCVVTDSNGSTTTNIVSVEVVDYSVPTISISASNTSVPKGDEVTLTATIDGVPAPTIQWYSNTTATNTGGLEISGATSETYKPATTTPGTYYFYAVATNSEGSATSDALTITVNLSNKCELTKVLYSNSFDAFIKDNVVTAYYMAGTATPDITTVNVSNDATYSVEGNTLTVTAEDGTTKADYTISLTAVDPYATYGETTFDGSESDWIKTGYTYTSEKGWRFSKNSDADGRIPEGWTRLYFFVDKATSVTLTNGGVTSDRNIKVYVNGVLKDEITKISKSTSSIIIPCNTATANMIAIVSNQTGGDGGFTKINIVPASVSGTISESGFNTFSSSYPLDLSTITNATAYVASAVEGDKVELVKTTDKVAAGEGLFLAGTVGETFTIGVTTEAATLTADNKLVGLPAGGEVPVGNYVFAWPTADPSAASFYIVETTPAALGAGKAYLNYTAGARLSLSFGEDAGEATGISEMKNVKADGTIFNLRGQRVAQPQKGLYILNGKKTIVK